MGRIRHGLKRLSVRFPSALEGRGPGDRRVRLLPLGLGAAGDRKGCDGTKDEGDTGRAIVPLDHQFAPPFGGERDPASQLLGRGRRSPVIAVYRGSVARRDRGASSFAYLRDSEGLGRAIPPFG